MASSLDQFSIVLPAVGEDVDLANVGPVEPAEGSDPHAQYQQGAQGNPAGIPAGAEDLLLPAALETEATENMAKRAGNQYDVDTSEKVEDTSRHVADEELNGARKLCARHTTICGLVFTHFGQVCWSYQLHCPCCDGSQEWSESDGHTLDDLIFCRSFAALSNINFDTAVGQQEVIALLTGSWGLFIPQEHRDAAAAGLLQIFWDFYDQPQHERGWRLAVLVFDLLTASSTVRKETNDCKMCRLEHRERRRVKRSRVARVCQRAFRVGRRHPIRRRPLVRG